MIGVFIGWGSLLFLAIQEDFSGQEIVGVEGTDPLDPRLVDINFMKTATLLDVQKSLAKGININSRDGAGRSLLYDIMFSERGEIAIFLIEKGADVTVETEDGYTPLHWAKNAEITKLLLDAGADVNTKDEDGRMPLREARNIEILMLLLDAGAEWKDAST